MKDTRPITLGLRESDDIKENKSHDRIVSKENNIGWNGIFFLNSQRN